MLSEIEFPRIVARANLAPSIHNIQPTRWRWVNGAVQIAADRSVSVPFADPDGAGCGLSVGAAVESTVLALSELGYTAQVTDHWAARNVNDWPGHQLAATLELQEGPMDPLAAYLAERGTWRGAFASRSPDLFGWTRPDTRLVFDAATKDQIAKLNDDASLVILRGKPFRKELLSWMRLSRDHPRSGWDGMNLAALRLEPNAARKVAWGLGPLWPILDAFGRTSEMTSEADATRATPLIAVFHRPRSESAIDTGRAYLRMWLEAASLGLAGWPMAALTDDPTTKHRLEQQFGIDEQRQLVQVMRLGVPTGALPQKARRPIFEVLG